MQTFHVQTIINHDGTLTLDNLPFRAGDPVEVTIVTHPSPSNGRPRYPLHGKPVQYTDPFGPVAQEDWIVLE